MILCRYWLCESTNFRLVVLVDVPLDVVLEALGVVFTALVTLPLHVKRGLFKVLGVELPHVPQDGLVYHIPSHALSVRSVSV